MNKIKLLPLGILTTLFLSFCMIPAIQAEDITGTVSYRQKIALPPNAELNLKLVEIDPAGKRASVIAERKLESLGKGSITFELPYDSSKIQESHRYSVQANIRAGDKMLMISPSLTPVLTQGNPKQEIKMNLIPAPTTGRAMSTEKP